MSDPRCPLCGSDRTTPHIQQRASTYRACATCGTAWLDPLPAPEVAAALYGETYFEGEGRGGYADYASDEALHRLNARDRLALLAQHRAPPGRVLDVGCALGFFLDEARAVGWQPAGVEVSAWCAAQVGERLGIEVHAELSAAAAAHAEGFDAICLFQVLEHLQDPVAALGEVRRMLAPDGVLLVETWDRSSAVARRLGRHWHQVNPPTVLHLFDRGSLQRTVRGAGFEVVSLEATSKRVSVGLVTSLLKHSHPRTLGRLHRVLGERVRGLGFRYDLGDLVTLVARPS